MAHAHNQPDSGTETRPETPIGASAQASPGRHVGAASLRDHHEASLLATAHLWPSLAGPASTSREPAKGADLLGERLGGIFANQWVRRLDWSGVKRIMKRAKGLATYSEAALDDAIATARMSIMPARDQRESMELVYAAAYEAVRRELGLSLHPQQLLGALALGRGCCAEMATGEGKTLTAILPAAFNAFTGRGVHIVTVNDYLARRDAQTTSAVYRRLGLSVGVIQESTTHADRRRAYAADVTYCSDKQIIFDFLRDRLAQPLAPNLSGVLLDGLLAGPSDAKHWAAEVVMRGLHAAIIDEADSVLIDEAITPAIISLPGSAGELLTALERAKDIVAPWRVGVEYTADLRLRQIELTPLGREALSRLSPTLPSFWAGPRRSEEAIVQALTAKELYRSGEDYVVTEGALMIVDRSTGRILPGRQWQLGLHQAVETKEGLTVSAPTRVAARSSYQAFYQGYRRLCGMSGTLREVRHELWRWYRLAVVTIPTHRPVARRVWPDRIYITAHEKHLAAAARAVELSRLGRPVLLGAWSITTSQSLSGLLESEGISHEVLNAVREPQEAAIIARAGEESTVTVATNMAGRGTDILLSSFSREAGGLAVIATDRHDEARVDRQLAGRAGRQGDPGSVETFVSLEDKLVEHNGLALLRWLAAQAPPPVRPWLARLLWWQAQHTASNKWATVRSQVAQADAWIDMALHHRTK